jgi:hypothetical protein
MSASGTPIFKNLSLGAGATGTIDFGQMVGYIYVRSIGPNTAYMTTGGTPPTPSEGDGRIGVVAQRPIEMHNTAVAELSFAMAGGESAEIEAVGIPVLSN